MWKAEEAKDPPSKPGGARDEPSFLTAHCIFTLRLPTPGSISASNRSNPQQIALEMIPTGVRGVVFTFPLTDLSGSYN